MQTEFKMLAERKSEVDAALDKLLKKAKRFDTVPLTFAWGPVFMEKKLVGNPEFPDVEIIPYQMLTVEGEPPRVGGWTFIARVEFEEAGILVQTVPGEHVPPKYFETNNQCEHCNKVRARKDVFVVRNEAGAHMQVGRQCLQDFLGNDPENVLRKFQWYKTFRDMLEQEMRNAPLNFAYDPVQLLTDTATCVRLFGWVSKGMAQQEAERSGREMEATVTKVRCRTSRDPQDVKWFKAEVQPFQNEGDKTLAEETIAWARALTSDNEYLHNLNVILSAEVVYQPKHLGLAVSAVSAFLREKQRTAELNLKYEKDKTSVHVGQVGERLRKIPVRMEAAIGLPPTEWGESTLFKFRDEAGNLYSVITQSSFDIGVEQAGLLTGTVKKHNVYKGVNETQLSRCVVEKVKAPVCLETEETK